jgi:curved DNA-binding protein CbpA
LPFASRKLPPPVDYFAPLQQPRRPWLDSEQLKQKYQQLTLAAHPDRAAVSKADLDFATINEAYRVLSDPKRRLQHLLSLEGHNPRATQSIPNELIELFGRIGSFIQETDRLLDNLGSANSALGKSLLRPQILDAQQRASELLAQLQTFYGNAEDQLRRLDASWDMRGERMIQELADLYHRFAYLGRWIEQLRERQFQLVI